MDIGLRGMIDGDPEKDNDLILEALRDQDFSTEGFVLKAGENDPNDRNTLMQRIGRARVFTHEIGYGATQKLVGNTEEGPIRDPSNYSRTHGEEWRERLQAAADFGNTLRYLLNSFVQDHGEEEGQDEDPLDTAARYLQQAQVITWMGRRETADKALAESSQATQE